jgi:rhamnulose-1-phosphate aldolase
LKILQTKFMQESIKVLNDLWLKGWDERNGGNFSYRILPEELAPWRTELTKEGRRLELLAPVPELGGAYFLVTGSGKYFRNVILEPEINLGLIRIADDGQSYMVLWGLTDGARPTSELPAHLLSHAARMKVTHGRSRVMLHTHATNLIALSYVLELTTANFTKWLWEMSTECLVVFPEGIGVIPWMMPGQPEIGRATAAQLSKHPLVLWPFHGVFSAGKDPDEAFGLVDTAEKAAEILVKVLAMGGKRQTITAAQLHELAAVFKVRPLNGVLK